jgi:putative spermidine/putrescine transport system substrate-binding protein
MGDAMIGRRRFLETFAAAGVAAGLPRAAAAADPLVVATFPGTWNEAHRELLTPYFHKRTGADVTQTVQLATDQVAKLTAARGHPPFDVAIMDEGPLLDAIKADVLERYPVAKSPNYADLLPVFQDPWGPKISIQVIGIGYNPKKIKTPPKSWDDLWSPAYKGRVGLTALNSTLGMAFMVDLARVKGGGESNIEPAFVALRQLLPNVGAISANLGAHATLFQQEQIDIAPYNFNFVQTLKEKGVDVAFAPLETGIPAWRTSLHVVKNAAQPELAVQYIDGHLAPEVQSAMEKPPFWIIPTNRKVPLAGEIVKQVAKSQDELSKLRYQDWAKINEGRSEWIERFNREIKI